MPPKLNLLIFLSWGFYIFSVICILNKLLFMLSSDLIPSAVYILEESIRHWYKEKFYQKKDNYLKWHQEPNLILLARVVSKCWHDQMGPNVNAVTLLKEWGVPGLFPALQIWSLLKSMELKKQNWISHSWVQWHCLGLISAKLKADSHLAEYCHEERSWWAANICFWKQSRNDAEARFLQSFETILQAYYVGQGTRQ